MDLTPKLANIPDNQFFRAVAPLKGETPEQYLDRRAQEPLFTWNSLIRAVATDQDLIPPPVMTVMHTPANCSLYYPDMEMVLPCYAFTVNSPETGYRTVIVPQHVAEDGRYQLEG